MYDDEHVNILKEALPIQPNHRSKGIERKKKSRM